MAPGGQLAGEVDFWIRCFWIPCIFGLLFWIALLDSSFGFVCMSMFIKKSIRSTFGVIGWHTVVNLKLLAGMPLGRTGLGNSSPY